MSGATAYHSLHPAEAPGLNDPPLSREYRETLEYWISEYPRRRRPEMRKRIFDPKTAMDDHYAARAEAFVNHVLVSKGWPIERHPRIAGVSTRPDFRVWSSLGRFIVEVKVALSEEETRQYEGAIAELVDYLASVRGRLRLHLTPISGMDRSIPKRKIKRFLERALSKLNPATCTEKEEWTFADGRVVLKFKVVWVAPEDGPVVSSWAMHYGEAREVTTHERIRKAVDAKVSHYGNVREPYLLVVEPKTLFGADEFVIERALFGDYGVTVHVSGDTVTRWSSTRSLNGVFTAHSNGRPLRTRLSAVAIYQHTPIGHEHNKFDLAIYHNPFATYPLDQTLFSEHPQMVIQKQTQTGIEMSSPALK